MGGALEIQGSGRGLGGLSWARMVVMMVTLGFPPTLLFHGPILGGPGTLRPGAVLLCFCCRPWLGLHRLPSGCGDAALLSPLGLLFLLHGRSSGTR